MDLYCSCHLRSLIKRLVSHHCTFGGYPHPCILSKVNFKAQPELLRFQWHEQGINLATITSNCVSGSQSISQRHSSYKVLAYPSFSGHAKNWIEVKMRFQAIATVHPADCNIFFYHCLWSEQLCLGLSLHLQRP